MSRVSLGRGSVRAVDDAGWTRLRDELHGGYVDLDQAFESRAARSEEAIGGAVAAVAHVAYHLGAIRQKVAGLRG